MSFQKKFFADANRFIHVDCGYFRGMVVSIGCDHAGPELKSLIEENSGKTVSSVSKKLNYLIIGDKPTKKKIDNAKQLRINVIDQAEFMRMLNITS